MWHEDYGPTCEERIPVGGEEMSALQEEAILQCQCCTYCGHLCDHEHLNDLTETGMEEYCRLDLDPGTIICLECLESVRVQFTPTDPSVFDVYTPVEFV
jgi:hypothetical protein